jgi:hypothetical protein
MKRFGIATFLFLVLAFASPATVYAQDAPAAEQPAAATGEKPVPEATRTTPIEPVKIDVKKAEDKKDGASIGDSAATGQIIHTVLTYLGGVLALLLVALVVQVLRKMGINISADTEKFLRKQADSVISSVDSWAAKLAKDGKKPKGSAKLTKGIELLNGIVKASGVANQPIEKLESIIEERLIRRKEKGEDVKIEKGGNVVRASDPKSPYVNK